MPDLSFPIGDNLNFTITITDEDGSPIDITNATIKWYVREKGLQTNLVEASSDGVTPEITLTDPTNGVCTVDVDNPGLVYGTSYKHEAKFRIGTTVEQIFIDNLYVTTSLIGSDI